jgi:hypothetical protein
MKTIWTSREAERVAHLCINEYGEIKSTSIKELSDASWWNGVLFGAMAAFMPGLFLLMAVRYLS